MLFFTASYFQCVLVLSDSASSPCACYGSSAISCGPAPFQRVAERSQHVVLDHDHCQVRQGRNCRQKERLSHLSSDMTRLYWLLIPLSARVNGYCTPSTAPPVYCEKLYTTLHCRNSITIDLLTLTLWPFSFACPGPYQPQTPLAYHNASCALNGNYCKFPKSNLLKHLKTLLTSPLAAQHCPKKGKRYQAPLVEQ